MKYPRSHAAAVALGNKAYLIGGVGEDQEPLTSVEIYDPQEERWIEGPPLSGPRSHLSAVMLGERIFALGGKVQRPDGSTEFLRTVEIFNPTTQTWDKGPDLLGVHGAGGAGIVRGIIYVVGGEQPEATKKDNSGMSFSERWDPLRKKWFEIPPLPTPRFDFSTIWYNGKLIVMGGKVRQANRDVLLDTSEAYDPNNKAWEDYPLTKLPQSTAGIGVCSMANLFIMGGETKEGLLDNTYSVDQLQKRWIKMDPIPEPRAYASVLTNVARLDNSMYVFAGRNAAGRPTGTVFSLKEATR